MSATPGNTVPDAQQIIAELQRKLDETRAELAARNSAYSERIAYQAAANDVLKVMSASPGDPQPVFDLISVRARDICGAYGVTVCEFDGSLLHWRAATGISDDPAVREANKAAFPLPPTRDLAAGRAILDRATVHIRDHETEPGLRRFSLTVKSSVAVPLMRGGVPIGTLQMGSRERGGFSDIQIELLKTFADQAVIAIGSAETYRALQTRTADLQESLQFQTATADVLKAISRSTFDLQTVLQTLVESAARLCEADKATITRQKDGVFYRAENFGFSREFMDYARNIPIEPEQGSAHGRALLQGHAVHIPDVKADPNYTFTEGQRLGDFRTILAVPMLREGAPIGVLALTRSVVRPFTAKQIELVTTFADQAAIAIGNVRLFEEVQARTRELSESLQQQTATADVLQVISASPGDLAPVFDRMLENAIRVCGAEFGSMNLTENGAMRPAAQHNVPAEYAAARGNRFFTPHPKSPLAASIRTKQVVHVADLRTTEAYLERSPTAIELVELGGARTVAIVPMLRDDEVIGAITIFRNEVQLFSDRQIDLLSNFAKQAVIAIENARLLKELRQRTDDLSKSLDDLRTAQDRLIQTEKLASLGQLTAGIAHEIKNPLNFVNNFSSLSAELTDELNNVLKPVAMDGKVRGEVDELTSLLKDNLEKVVQHGKRADSIVKNMLLHSRHGSGEQRSADVNALVEESLNLAYHGARAEKSGFEIRLQSDFDPDAGAAQLYPQEITRALLNLISNGFYAATKRKVQSGDESFEPVLSASTRNLGKMIEIRVRDNGTGIPPEVKEKMFVPFFTTKPTGEGTGLGLSMTHDIIVKQHGGRIDVETEPGAFTEFIITLPRDNGNTGGLKFE
jgi:signal transduction histidine kinase